MSAERFPAARSGAYRTTALLGLPAERARTSGRKPSTATVRTARTVLGFRDLDTNVVEYGSPAPGITAGPTAWPEWRAVTGKVLHAVISCHDFLADAGKGEHFRTSSAVEEALSGWGFDVSRRPDDLRPWVREYRYATGLRSECGRASVLGSASVRLDLPPPQGACVEQLSVSR